MGKCIIVNPDHVIDIEGVTMEGHVYGLGEAGELLGMKEIFGESCFINPLVFIENHKWGMFDYDTGAVTIPPIYDGCTVFYEGLAKVMQKGKWGCIRSNGEIVVPIVWDKIEGFRDGGGEDYDLIPIPDKRAAVLSKRKWGFINNQGRIIVEPQYDEVGEFGNRLCPVSKAGKWGYIDCMGNEIVPLIYDKVTTFIEKVDRSQSTCRKKHLIGRYAAAHIEGKWSFIDEKGNIKTKPIIDEDSPIGNGSSCWLVYVDGKRGILDGDLTLILEEPGQEYIIFEGEKIYFSN